MATLKICVQKPRSDGYYYVYIRVTHRGKQAYIRTDKMVTQKGLSRAGEVTDKFVLRTLSDTLVEYNDRLNRKDISKWDVKQVVEFLKAGDDDICFSDYARKYIAKMQDSGMVRNAKNYEYALNHLERYAGTNKLMISRLTVPFVSGWIESLSGTNRAKEMYPICVRQVFKAALAEYNDYDEGSIRIKVNPWMRVKIPKPEKPEKLAITPDEVRKFFAAPLPPTKIAEPLSEIGRDVAMLVLCLAGINTVDLYHMKKADYRDGILHYRRRKTTKFRSDEAYIEMRVPSILLPIFDKYATPDDDEYLFSFHNRFSTSDSLGSGANTGIKQICERSLGMTNKDDWYCVYTFRHTWGTTAQNDCGASYAEVGFAMNHSGSHEVTRGYVKPDFSPAWRLNEKVVDFLFFTTEKGSRQQPNDEPGFFRFSKKHLVKGELFYKGEKHGEVEDIGFNNIDEVIKRLVPFVPEDVPHRAMVQFKITIVDKGQSAVYERMKGKGF